MGILKAIIFSLIMLVWLWLAGEAVERECFSESFLYIGFAVCNYKLIWKMLE